MAVAEIRYRICPTLCHNQILDNCLDVICPPEKKTIEEWLIQEKGVILPERGNAFPGILRLDKTPYLRKPLEEFTNPDVERIGLCFSRQLGKTTYLFVALGYTIDYDPDSVMIMYPTQDMAREVSRERVKPMIDATPTLARHKTSDENDYQNLLYSLDRMTVRWAHAGSEVSARSHPIRILIKDETSAMTSSASSNADDTTTSFWNRKIIEGSTPMHQGDNMCRFLGIEPREGLKGEELFDTDAWIPKGSTKVYFFHVPCPHCGSYIQFLWRQLRWPDDIPIRDIPGKGWYECQCCQEKIYDHHKDKMVSLGEWQVHESQKDMGRAKWIGFVLNKMYGPWDSCRFGVVGQTGLRAKISKDPDIVGRFVNNVLGLPYSLENETVDIISEESITSNVLAYSRNTIPKDCRVLSIGIDVGKETASRVHWVVQGFGPNQMSWRISWGILDDLYQMEQYINQQVFQHPIAGDMRIYLGGADSRWNKPEVIAFCKRMRGRIFPIVGEQNIRPDPGNVQAMPHKAYFPERDGNGKAIPNGLTGYRINTMYWKQWIYGRINCLYGQKPTFFFPSERDAVIERHLRSEEEILVRVKGKAEMKRQWVLKKGYSANHYLDAVLYGCAVANVFNLMNHAEDGAIFTGISKKKKIDGDQNNKMNFPKMKF